jgi:hypothetical protein
MIRQSFRPEFPDRISARFAVQTEYSSSEIASSQAAGSEPDRIRMVASPLL